MRHNHQMEEGYSIPSEKEIHIGMEFELRTFKGWTKKAISNLQDMILVFQSLKHGRVRVKNLDESAFLNEGWVKEENKFIKNNFSLTYNDSRLEIFYKENRCFAGSCKTLNTFHSICTFVKI